MLIIRLARHGRKKAPFYHLVVAEKAKAVQKKYVARIGYYNPLANEGKGELVFDQEKITLYVNNGAQMSQTAARLLSKAGCKEAGKFVVARVTKPKKEEPKPEPEEAPAPAAEEAPAEEAEAAPAEEPAKEEAPADETPAEEPAKEEAAEETKEDAPAEESEEKPAEEEKPADEDKKSE